MASIAIAINYKFSLRLIDSHKPSFRRTLRSFLFGDCGDGTWLALTSKQLNLSDLFVGILLAIPNVRLRVALSMQGVSHESLKLPFHESEEIA